MHFRTSLTLLVFFVSVSFVMAQDIEFPSMDASPLDAANYPRTAAFNNYMSEEDKKDLKIKVLYSRPKKKGRDIFGGLESYGEEWRLGANEATEVLFNQPVEIGGVALPAGYYTMFAELYPNNWIIKLSTERFIAGTRNRDKSKDVVSVNVPVERVADVRESFTIGFKEIDEMNVHMIFAWDNVQAALPIAFNPVYMAGDDASPMDLAQYPRSSRTMNFLDEDKKAESLPKVRVVYSRPQLKGRKIFGELYKEGDAWRLGANETTEITFFDDVMIGGEKVKKGRYGMFVVLDKDKWEFVIHTNIPSWGTPNHDESTNVATFSVPTEKTPEKVENMSILFKEIDKNEKVHMIVAWDDTMVQVPIEM
ncbi:MAG: DUF2911 domain-containing protein [Bacteroidota bacterium]